MENYKQALCNAIKESTSKRTLERFENYVVEYLSYVTDSDAPIHEWIDLSIDTYTSPKAVETFAEEYADEVNEVICNYGGSEEEAVKSVMYNIVCDDFDSNNDIAKLVALDYINDTKEVAEVEKIWVSLPPKEKSELLSEVIDGLGNIYIDSCVCEIVGVYNNFVNKIIERGQK